MPVLVYGMGIEVPGYELLRGFCMSILNQSINIQPIFSISPIFLPYFFVLFVCWTNFAHGKTNLNLIVNV